MGPNPYGGTLHGVFLHKDLAITISSMQTCRLCQSSFQVTDEDRTFYQSMGVPEPTLCPTDRARNRLAFRNLRYLNKRKCNATGKNIFTHYPDNVPFPVYEKDYWWSDKWDALGYGREFDFSRPFFEQFKELLNVVPALDRSVILSENCDYCNGCAYGKNCYLSFNFDYCENCYYLSQGRHCTLCVDCLGMVDCELCYECVLCDNCYNLNYSTRCTNCSDSYFLIDCRQCKNCIGCVNLVGKEYYIFNQKVPPEQFEAKKKELQTRSGVKQFKKELEVFQKQFPKKYYHGHSNENFSGNDLRHVKNSHHCFYADGLEDSKYCNFVFKADHCYDYDIFGGNSSWIYNCMAVGNNCTYNICCMHTWNGSSYNYYSHLLSGSSYCFGSIGLKHKQYCILNKQYSKEEYEELVPKIIEHMKQNSEWGEFFPFEFSPHAFNKTYAFEYYPLEKEEILKRGWQYEEIKDRTPDVEKVIEDASLLPENIDSIPNDILNWAIRCQKSGRPFLITKQELQFYRNQNIPIPTEHPDIRHSERLKRHHSYVLYEKHCDNCQTGIQTTYSPDREEKVYCEVCYLEGLN